MHLVGNCFPKHAELTSFAGAAGYSVQNSDSLFRQQKENLGTKLKVVFFFFFSLNFAPEIVTWKAKLPKRSKITLIFVCLSEVRKTQATYLGLVAKVALKQCQKHLGQRGWY